MISTKGRYGLRIMLDIAIQDPESNVALKDIAERQHISKKYLEIIAKTLVQSKLLHATSGKGGGYRHARATDTYTVGEIIEALEGSLCSVACTKPYAETCPYESTCLTKHLWSGYDELTRNYFFSKKLSELIPR